LKQVIEGKIEWTGRRGTRRKQLLSDLKKTRGYGKSKEKALERTALRTRFERQTAIGMISRTGLPFIKLVLCKIGIV
jgi:hypothetical protein